MRIMPPSGNRRTNRQRVGRHARILELLLNASTYDRSRGNRIFVLRWLVAVDVVVANGKNRMRLSSRLIRGAVNPTKIFVRIRFTTSTEREKQSKRNRERERERGEAAILIKRATINEFLRDAVSKEGAIGRLRLFECTFRRETIITLKTMATAAASESRDERRRRRNAAWMPTLSKVGARWKLLNPARLSVFHCAQETSLPFLLSPSSSLSSHFVIETKT